MNIDDQLTQIIIKYKLNTYYPEWNQFYQSRLLIKRMFQEIPKDKTIALRGAGKHTDKLLSIIDEAGLKEQINFIVDDNPKTNEINGIPVLTTNEAEQQKIDVYVISSFRYGLEMEVMLWKNLPTGTNVINLYHYLRMNGCPLNTEFYNIDRPYITYPDIYCSKKQYRRAQDIETQRKYLQILIFQCLEIRDFMSAEEYVKEYINKGFDDHTYESAWSEIEQLLFGIEELLRKRDCKDIIINWIDAIEYSGLKEMSFIDEICKGGLVFSNSFSPMIYTDTVMASMFLEKLPIEGKTYLFDEKYSIENSVLLKHLEEGGYHFKYIAYPYIGENVLDVKYRIDYEKAYRKLVCHNLNIGCSTRLQWNALQERLEAKHPVCHMIHNLAETHEPYLSVWLDDDMSVDRWDMDSEKRRYISRNYMDAQLRFYARFLDEKVARIYLTDHGNANRGYIDDRSRVLMVLYGNIPKVGKEDGIYSHLYFNRVIRYIIDPSETRYNDIFSEYAILENIEAYDPTFIRQLEAIVRKQTNLVKILANFYQYRAIRTVDDLYVHYAIGKELYFVLPDEENNLIDCAQYQERISQLRDLCGDFFIDSNDEHFSECKRLYLLAEEIGGMEW